MCHGGFPYSVSHLLISDQYRKEEREEFLALKGVNFFMLKSYVRVSQINDIMDGSVCMTTLKAKKN